MLKLMNKIYLEGGPCDGSEAEIEGTEYFVSTHPTQLFTKEDSERIYQKASFYRNRYVHTRDWNGKMILTYFGTEVVF